MNILCKITPTICFWYWEISWSIIARTIITICLLCFRLWGILIWSHDETLVTRSDWIQIDCSFIYFSTLCMKLSWFCHTNSGQLFCNCPLFVTALVPGHFLAGNQTRRVVILLLLQNGGKLESVSLLCRTKILQLKHRQRLFRVWQFNVWRSWKSNVSTTSNWSAMTLLLLSLAWESSSWSKGLKVRNYKSWLMKSVINKELHVF